MRDTVFIKDLKEIQEANISDKISQGMLYSMLQECQCLGDSLPKEMHDKLAVFRKPTISQCVIYESIEGISNINK